MPPWPTPSLSPTTHSASPPRSQLLSRSQPLVPRPSPSRLLSPSLSLVLHRPSSPLLRQLSSLLLPLLRSLHLCELSASSLPYATRSHPRRSEPPGPHFGSRPSTVPTSAFHSLQPRLGLTAPDLRHPMPPPFFRAPAPTTPMAPMLRSLTTDFLSPASPTLSSVPSPAVASGGCPRAARASSSISWLTKVPCSSPHRRPHATPPSPVGSESSQRLCASHPHHSPRSCAGFRPCPPHSSTP